MAAGVEEPNALVQIEAPFPEPMLPATTVELYDGLVATGLPGQGRLADRARPRALRRRARPLRRAGGRRRPGRPRPRPATAARTGARVILLDDQPELGGVAARHRPSGSTARPPWSGSPPSWPSSRPSPRSRVLQPHHAPSAPTTTTTSSPLERAPTTSALAAPAHLSRAAGLAHPGPAGRPGHRRPRAPAGLRGQRPPGHHARRRGPHLPQPLRRALPAAGPWSFTTNDSAYAAAVDLGDAGRRGRRRRRRPAAGARALGRASARERGIEVLTGQVVTGTQRGADASRRRTSPSCGDGRLGAAREHRLRPARWSPAAGTPPCTCFSQAPGQAALRRRRSARSCPAPTSGRGRGGRLGAGGGFTLAACLARRLAAGRRGGRRPAASTSPEPVDARSSRGRRTAEPSPTLWSVPGAGRAGLTGTTQFVDLQRDLTVADVLRATGAGMRSVEHVKRYTTIGTANDQGKTSGVIAIAASSPTLLGVRASPTLGTTTFRPPYTPVSFAALAGRDRGAPARPRPGHPHPRLARRARRRCSRTSGSGSGPGTTRRPARTWRPPCCASARAARERVAIMDASTLGKIDVQGAGRRPSSSTASTPT